MRVTKLSSGMFAIVVVLAAACGSSTSPGGTGSAGSSAAGSSGSAGKGGSPGSAGTSGSAGATGRGGTSGTAGTSGRGGTSGGAGTTGSGGSGTQPIGAACANTGNCSQADGPAICCLSIPACVLETQCPTGPNYIPCNMTTNPCSKAGWVCCNAGGMSFCTKQSGCPSP
jgi:hypothetical protein